MTSALGFGGLFCEYACFLEPPDDDSFPKNWYSSLGVETVNGKNWYIGSFHGREDDETLTWEGYSGESLRFCLSTPLLLKIFTFSISFQAAALRERRFETAVSDLQGVFLESVALFNASAF